MAARTSWRAISLGLALRVGTLADDKPLGGRGRCSITSSNTSDPDPVRVRESLGFVCSMQRHLVRVVVR